MTIFGSGLDWPCNADMYTFLNVDSHCNTGVYIHTCMAYSSVVLPKGARLVSCSRPFSRLHFCMISYKTEGGSSRLCESSTYHT